VARRDVIRGEELFFDYGIHDKDIPWLITKPKQKIEADKSNREAEIPKPRKYCVLDWCSTKPLKLMQHLWQHHKISNKAELEQLCRNARKVHMSTLHTTLIPTFTLFWILLGWYAVGYAFGRSTNLHKMKNQSIKNLSIARCVLILYNNICWRTADHVCKKPHHYAIRFFNKIYHILHLLKDKLRASEEGENYRAEDEDYRPSKKPWHYNVSSHRF